MAIYTPGSIARKARILLSSTLALALGLASLGLSPGLCQSQKRLIMPTRYPTPMRTAAPTYEDDILLISPARDAESDDINDALKEVHGTVVGTIGQGQDKILLVKTEKGKLAETEKKLSKDKHFSSISRNGMTKAQVAAASDPVYTQEWHLTATNCAGAWKLGATGKGQKICIFDGGCQERIEDLNQKTDKGFRRGTDMEKAGAFFGLGLAGTAIMETEGMPGTTDVDPRSHGTKCATVAAADTNRVNTVGVAPDARISPVQVGVIQANGNLMAPDDRVIEAFDWAMRKGIKIISFSYNGNYPNSYAARPGAKQIRDRMQLFYAKGGLVFVSAGNDKTYDPTPRAPYMVVVSAVMPDGQGYSLADLPTWGSNYGNPVWFTAPGVDIPCSDRVGNLFRTFGGTSAAAPICAGIAALVWSANPGLTNNQVLDIMARSCKKAEGSSGWNVFYGYGMPDAAEAVKLASGK